MNTYAEVGSSFQQMGGECPDGWVEMLGPRPDDENSLDYTAQPDGTWAVSEETVRAKQAEVESVWREQQMPVAQQNVTALTYGADDIPGSEEGWQKYWLALRKWTGTNPDFPDSAKRPVAPS